MNNAIPPAEQHASVLNGTVLVKEPSPHRSNLISFQQPAEQRIPPGAPHLHVVIRENKQRRIDLCRRLIIEMRPIEGLIEAQKANVVQSCKIGQDLKIVVATSAVIDDKERYGLWRSGCAA